MVEVNITKELVCKLASCSLLGICMEEVYKQTGKYGKAPVRIIFCGSSMEYCRSHNGPELLIMPDYVPFCIAESILEMTKKGWEITLELKELD